VGDQATPGTPERSWGVRVARTTVLAGAAAAAGLLAVRFSAPLALLAAVFAAGAVAWHAPQAAVRALVVLFVVTPVVSVTPFLQPQDLNYSAYFAALSLPVCVAVCARSGVLRLDSGALFLVIMAVNATATIALHGLVTADYGLLVWGITALSLYLSLSATRENLHGLVTASVLCLAFAEACIGISQSLTGWPLFSLAETQLAVTDRGLIGYFLPYFAKTVTNGVGTFAHFNHLGALLSLALPIAFGRLLRRPRGWADVVLVAVLAIGLLTSYSRAGWVGGLVGCLGVYWASRPRSSRSWLPIFAGAILLLGALTAPYLVSYYTSTQNVSTRVSTWDYAIGRWIDSPQAMPFGLGFGSFQAELLTGASAAGTRALDALHSGLLQILLELGIVGAVVFAWFVVTTLRPHLVLRRPGWQPALAGGIVGLLVSQCLDNALFAVMGILMFAMAACLRRSDARTSPDAAGKHGP
jgi:hypothetical protein